MNKNWLAFDPHNFGYAKLDDLVIASELFELRRDTRLRARVWVSESGENGRVRSAAGCCQVR